MKRQLSCMPGSTTQGCGAAECTECATEPGLPAPPTPPRSDPARLSPQRCDASWHPVRQHQSYFSTPSSPLSQCTPTLPKLSMYFVFIRRQGCAMDPRGFRRVRAGRALCKVKCLLQPCLSSLLAAWGS